MSNIGKLPVKLNEQTKLNIEKNLVKISGPKGELSFKKPKGISINIQDGEAIVKKDKDDKKLEQYYGLTRALLANAVKGVNEGFEKKLQMEGVGYRAKVEGNDLLLNVGYANQIKITAPDGISLKVQKNIITVEGIDKELIGNTAATIRAVKPPEPYKGKGIRYQGEYIRRKAGKAAQKAE